MEYLGPNDRNHLADKVYEALEGYADPIRNTLLADVHPKFRALLNRSPGNEMVQLDMDLKRLNSVRRLTDGTVPFYSWLQNTARYVQQMPDALRAVQLGLAAIEDKATKSEPVANTQPPSQVAVGNIAKEKIIQQNDLVSYSWLEDGYRAGSGVMKVIVPKYIDGQPVTQSGNPIRYSGTGWLLSKELVMTNHHVVNARDDGEADAAIPDLLLQGANIIAEFDFNSDSMVGTVVKAVKLEATDPELDYAILRLASPVERLRLARYLSEVQITENNPQVVNIIQHPFGYGKKVAFRNNHIYESPYPKVHYFTDTEKGSSGSPVFDDGWRVIALHRASQLVEGVQYQGKSTGWVNEGIQLKAIFDHLEQHFNALSIEVLNS